MRGTRNGDLEESPPDSIFSTTGPQRGFRRSQYSHCSRPEFVQAPGAVPPVFFSVIDSSLEPEISNDLWTEMWITFPEDPSSAGTRTITDLHLGIAPENPGFTPTGELPLCTKRRSTRG